MPGVTIDVTANLARFQSSFDKATDKLDRFQKNAQRRSRQLQRTFSNLGKSVGVAFAGLSIGNIAAGVIDTSRKFEVLKTSLISVTGSAEAATSAFSEIEQFSRRTPFQLTEVVTAFKKMTALGLQPTTAELESFGNTAVAMGKSLDQFIEAIADASTGEFERLKEFGIKSRKRGEEITFTFQGIEKTVRNTSSDIVGYLRDIGNVQFSGAMVRQMDTLDGAFSNFGDAVDALAVSIGESGLNEAIADLTNTFTGFVRSATTIVKSFQDIDKGLSIQAIESKLASLRESVRLSTEEFKSFSLASLNPFSKGKNIADIALANREIKRLEKRLAELKATGDTFDLENPIDSIEGLSEGSAEASNEAEKARKELESFADSLTNKFNPSIAIKEEIERINAAFDKGIISQETKTKALNDALRRLNEIDLSNASKEVSDFAQDLSVMGRAMDLIDKQFAELDRQEAIEFAGLGEIDIDESFSELEKFADKIDQEFNPEDIILDKMELIDQAFQENLIDSSTYLQALDAEFKKLDGSLDETVDTISQFADKAAGNLQDVFADFLFDPFDKGLKGMFDGFSEMLRRMAAELAAQQLLLAVFKSISGTGFDIGGIAGDFVSSLQGRATGGSVTAGTPYIVGEAGPELYVPKVSGTIYPNGSAAGLNQTININMTGQIDSRTTQQLAVQVGTATQRAIRRNA